MTTEPTTIGEYIDASSAIVAADDGELAHRPSPPPPRRKNGPFMSLLWIILGLVIVVPVAGVIIRIKQRQFQTMADAKANMVVMPQPVNSIEVQQDTWHPRVQAVGSIMAFQGTVVSAEADGIIREILFEAGAEVAKDAELVTLDVAIEEAQLREAEAAAEWARVTYERAKQLVASKGIAQAEFDSAQADFKKATAQVDNLRAVIAKKTVRAPFAGQLGIRHVSVGQFLNKGSPVVSLHALDPVYVEFSLPQQQLGQLAPGLEVEVLTDSYPGERFPGTVTAINPDVDPATRNVRVQATLDNKDGRLRPGMFVSVELILAASETVTFIPVTAVMHAPFGDSVFVIEEGEPADDGTRPLVVRQQFVRLGARQGDFVVVTEGVTPGQQIVSTGVFKLRPGMPVRIDNTLAPTFSLNPHPKNT
jgi:membrane fusion protein (multidrug efflux system)